ncbi:PIN domain-containing protein [Catellatospora methionotrophica]|uniref:PIN domain-containing protein n=1 Tax=Catellatospora methionotrophica TaxID=121620 RepID=UPI0033FDC119
MKYLIDTSALVRIVRRQVDDHWHEQVTRGLVAICDPVLVETLTIADAKAYTRVEDALREAYPWVPVPDDAWDIITSVRRELATRSVHQGLSVADHLVAATAIRLKLTVLHEDADFETAAEMIPQLKQQRILQATDA